MYAVVNSLNINIALKAIFLKSFAEFEIFCCIVVNKIKFSIVYNNNITKIRYSYFKISFHIYDIKFSFKL